jgi:hypothetical protein
MALSKEQIMGAQDVGQEEVDVPEWGGSVTIRALTAKNRASWLESIEGEKDFSTDCKLVAFCMVDENDEPLLTPEELALKSGDVVSRLAKVAGKLNGMEPGAVEEAEKN